MNSWSEIIAATLRIYYLSAQNGVKTCLRNYALLPGTVILVIAYLAIMGILTPLAFGTAGMAIGFIVAIVKIAALSFYYSWIETCATGQKLPFKQLWHFDYSIFSRILSAAFILFIIRFIVSQVTRGTELAWLNLGVALVIFIVFNATTEIIIVERAEGGRALADSASFVKDNWIEWFLPLVLILSPLILGQPDRTLILLSTSSPLLPGFITVQQVLELNYSASIKLPTLFVLLCLFNWFSLFRINLFKELNSGSRRKRIFELRQ